MWSCSAWKAQGEPRLGGFCLNSGFPQALQDFPCGSDGKASAYNAGDLGSIPGLGRSPGEGNGNPLQYPCLENPMDGDYSPWGHKESTGLRNFHFHFHFPSSVVAPRQLYDSLRFYGKLWRKKLLYNIISLLNSYFEISVMMTAKAQDIISHKN